MDAQTSRGTLTGFVTDPQDLPVPGAAVTAMNEATSVVRRTSTNAAGFYRFDAIDPGLYTIAVTQAGLAPYTKTGIPVDAARTVSTDARLTLARENVKVEVRAGAETALQYESPLRGGNVGSTAISELPYSTRRPVQLALTLPGVSTNRYVSVTGTVTGSYAVNGLRPRSNNFMIDGTENNDISTTGEGLTFAIPDAVMEVSVLTSNFDAEFGRAAGGVINVITKSGTNQYHGTASYVLDSTYDDALTNTQSLSADIRQRGRPPFGIEQWWGGTFGGPVRKNRTFFFAAFQEQRQRLNATNRLRAPTSAGWNVLNSLFPKGANANADLYRDLTRGLQADSQPSLEQLGAGRPAVEFGTAVTMFAASTLDREYVGRVDHQLSERDQLAARYIRMERTSPRGAVLNIFPGFEVSSVVRNDNASVIETHIFSPGWTNEIRFNFNRLDPSFPPDGGHSQTYLAPYIQIGQGAITSIGLDSRFPQGRTGNNYSIQDTMTIVKGAHSIRAGADLLQQRSRQYAPFPNRGLADFRAGGGFSAFANFLDDFAGSGGLIERDFGSPVYYPSLNRLAFFATDRWRVRSTLALTLGLRYEYFGTPMNAVRTAAFAGLFNVDPVTFTGPFSQPSKVSRDWNNFSPSVGLAWSPGTADGWWGKLIGNRKSVVRAGYTIGYDAFFNNMASSAQTSTPNVIAYQIASATDQPRGLPNALRALPLSPRPPDPLDAQTLLAPNLVNPYAQHWSFGVQRELPGGFVYDVTYVGSKGTRLFLTEDYNPQVAANLRITPATTAPLPASRLSGRLDNLQGPRLVRTNGGDSNYHALQMQATRRMAAGLTVVASYTWSKLIDNGSDPVNVSPTNAPATLGRPTVFGGLQLDRGLSLFHRAHRAVFSYVYELPFWRAQHGVLGRALGGWEASGIATFETGVPLNVLNGVDTDGVGGATADRPNVNPGGSAGTRAVPDANSPTGYVNPDAAGRPAIDPATARYIGIASFPATRRDPLPPGNAGRNTEFTPGINNFDIALTKRIRIHERWRMEFRGDAYNVFNHPQYGVGSVSPFSGVQSGIQSNVFSSPAGTFLKPMFADGGGRVLRYQLRLSF